ncbi:MAG: NDP-sugar synthase [Dehalococcoidales bacterium]|nr:NDP-sugar synthase [Dehalococcoidales bacterium]
MLSQAVILVGGQGTRLRPLTYRLPKPMIPVLNRPFLEHTLAYLKSHGVGSAILALSYLPEAIQSHLGNGANHNMALSYAVEASPLGTAGAVKNAEPYLEGTFAVLNGDIFTDLNLDAMLGFHRSRGAEATIALTRVDDPCSFGVVETEEGGRVRRFVEKPSPDQVTSHWINAGVYILEPEVLRHIPQASHYMFERGLFPRLLELGEPVYGYPFSGYWLDMGTPEKYLNLNCDLLSAKVISHLIPDLSRDGVSCAADTVIHPSASISGPVVIGGGSRIDRGARITGPVVIGADCRIGEGASLERAVLWTGVSIEAGSRLKQCLVNRSETGGKEQVISFGQP